MVNAWDKCEVVLLFFLVSLLFIPIIYAQQVQISLDIKPDKFNLLFSPFQQDASLEVVGGDATTKKILRWVPYLFFPARKRGGFTTEKIALRQGEGYFVKTPLSQLTLQGTLRESQTITLQNNEPAFFVIGTLRNIPTPLRDIQLIDGDNPPIPFVEGAGNYYQNIFDYDPDATPKLILITPTQEKMLLPGKGYLMRALKSFTLILNEEAPVDHDGDGYSAGGDCDDNNQAIYPGQQSECYTGSGEKAGTGECHRGTKTCQTDGLWSACEGSVLPSNEMCDDLDNDCDGQIDNGIGNREYYPQDQDQTKIGVGVCAKGTETCTQGNWQVQTAAVIPGNELCGNDIDEDCDGTTAACALGTACTGDSQCGQGKCVGEIGAKVCCADAGADYYYDADGDGYGVETNDKPKRRLCAVDSTGKYTATQDDDCDDGSEDVKPGVTETCDNLDNNCDGATDGITQECYSPGLDDASLQHTPCKKGTQRCSSGQWGSCAGEIVPSLEQCDGVDNNCNGESDDGIPPQPYYSGTEETKNKGECKDGLKSCVDGKWEITTSDALPTSEVCDGKDNNCDGQVDNNILASNLPNNPNQNGVCAGSKKTCINGQLQEDYLGVTGYQSTETLCDNLDNDCDGTKDNIATTSLPNNDDMDGVCNGKKSCDSAAKAFVNNYPAAYRSADTLCDGLDNDCDGQTDEAADNPCNDNTKICLQAACKIKTGESCTSPVTTTALPGCEGGYCVHDKCRSAATFCGDEFCDSGETCASEDLRCIYANAVGECKNGCGLKSCNAGFGNCDNNNGNGCETDTQTNTNHCGQCGNACGANNKCERGECVPLCIDEDGDGYGSSGTGCPNQGVDCIDSLNDPLAQNIHPGATETCNGVDDDCDGTADEDNSCGPVTFSLNSPQLQASAISSELCNGRDDDGNNLVDDGLDANKCACAANARQPGTQTESCNSIDDDCDGAVDEELTGASCYRGAVGTDGIGTCKSGTMVCTNGQWEGCVGEQLPLAETCDGKDNDCDGSTDENNVCPAAETCNGIDDDQDGKIDENDASFYQYMHRLCPGITPTRAANGDCLVGFQKCTTGQWVNDWTKSDGSCGISTVPKQGSFWPLETCDDADNNCNGIIDDYCVNYRTRIQLVSTQLQKGQTLVVRG